MAPVVPGLEKYDAYPPADATANHGDVDKAKQLLGGATPPKYKYCVANTPTNQKVAGVITQGLERAGFTFTINYIERANYYTTVGVKGTDCDIIAGGWGQDYPDGGATLDVLWNGSSIKATGNQNLSYFNEPAVNAKMDELRKNPDRGAVAKEYAKLDKELMEKYAVAIPTRNLRNFFMIGPNVGNTWPSPVFATFNVTNVYVK